jgi:hypothetical protein
MSAWCDPTGVNGMSRDVAGTSTIVRGEKLVDEE